MCDNIKAGELSIIELDERKKTMWVHQHVFTFGEVGGADVESRPRAFLRSFPHQLVMHWGDVYVLFYQLLYCSILILKKLGI